MKEFIIGIIVGIILSILIGWFIYEPPTRVKQKSGMEKKLDELKNRLTEPEGSRVKKEAHKSMKTRETQTATSRRQSDEKDEPKINKLQEDLNEILEFANGTVFILAEITKK